MWHESGCSCCWWSQWHCQKPSLIAFFLSLYLRCLLELLLQLIKAAKTFPFCFPKFLHADTSVVSLQWQFDTYSICLFFSSFRDQVLHPQRCYVSCKKKLKAFLHLSIFIKGQGSIIFQRENIVPYDHCMIFLHPFCLWKGFNFSHKWSWLTMQLRLLSLYVREVCTYMNLQVL